MELKRTDKFFFLIFLQLFSESELFPVKRSALLAPLIALPVSSEIASFLFPSFKYSIIKGIPMG